MSPESSLLAEILLRPLLLAFAAWLMLRVMRIRHPASRHAVWTAVLAGMFLLPAIGPLVPRWSLPVLPRTRAAAAPLGAPTAFSGAASVNLVSREPSTPSRQKPPSVLTILYLAGLLAMLLYRTIGWALMRRVIARSTPVRAGHLRESADVLTPAAAGIFRPIVILPADWRTWSLTTRRGVLAHEFAHLRRHDPLVSAAARLAKTIFWFHPLAWWLAREISDLAELACDAAALQRLPDPAVYSRILLEFAGAVNRAGRRVALPGLAMASNSNIAPRIDRIFELSAGNARKLARPALLLPVMGLPVMCLAAVVGLSDSPQSATVKAPADAPKFEVVSIKTSTHCSDNGGGRGGAGRMRTDPGMISLDCQNVEFLIQRAYILFASGKPFPISPTTGLPDRPSGRDLNEPIKGSPAWLSTDRYDIEAKAASPQAREMMLGPMMQGLLEDRFQLKMHRESRDVPVYELTVAKGGPKFSAAQKGECVPIDIDNPPDPQSGQPIPKLCGMVRVTDGEVQMSGVTMADLCKQLSATLDRDVIDKTGLTGVYDLRAKAPLVDPVNPDVPPQNPTMEMMAALLTDAVEKLGLKLKPAKASRYFLVIDHVERPWGN